MLDFVRETPEGRAQQTDGAVVRYSDSPVDWQARAAGGGGTMALFALVGFLAFFTWRAVLPAAVPAPLVVDLMAFSAPPEPVQEVPEGPQQVEQKAQEPEKRKEKPEPPEIVVLQPSPIAAVAEPPVNQAKAAEPVPQTTAPKSLPAPPANHASSSTETTWEALLLAHLEKHRRYPAAARARREQGIAHVMFRMNRQGQLLSASIARSSGSAALDRAALDTLRRAQPLPPIPADKPDPLELSVPVEFFVKG